MIRKLVPLVSLAALLGACASGGSSSGSTQSGAPAASRGVNDQGGRDGGRRGPGGPGGQRMEQRLLQGITLTQDQQQRIDAIRASYRQQMEQLRQQSGGDREAMRGQMRPLMEKQQAEIRAVLTPDQQKIYDQNVTEMRQRMQQGPRGDRQG